MGKEKENKKWGAGDQDTIISLYFSPSPLSSGCLLALSPFLPSPLEVNGQTEGEMRPTGVEWTGKMR